MVCTQVHTLRRGLIVDSSEGKKKIIKLSSISVDLLCQVSKYVSSPVSLGPNKWVILDGNSSQEGNVVEESLGTHLAWIHFLLILIFVFILVLHLLYSGIYNSRGTSILCQSALMEARGSGYKSEALKQCLDSLDKATLREMYNTSVLTIKIVHLKAAFW